MKVWVTGANGFLGNRLVQSFSRSGHDVVGLSRTNTRPVPSTVNFYSCDLSTPDSVESLSRFIEKHGAPDAVFHAAALQPCTRGFKDFFESNVQTVKSILEVFQKVDLPLFVLFSTTSVFCASSAEAVDEAGPVCWENNYTATKLMSEITTARYSTAESTLILRLPSLYGVGQDDSFVDGLLNRISQNGSVELWDNGERVRDAIHVSEVVRVCEGFLNMNNRPASSVINVGPPKAYTTYDYADQLVKAFALKATITRVDRQSKMKSDLHVDSSRLKRFLEMELVPLSESMQRYANEVKTNG